MYIKIHIYKLDGRGIVNVRFQGGMLKGLALFIPLGLRELSLWINLCSLTSGLDALLLEDKIKTIKFVKIPFFNKFMVNHYMHT